MGKGKSEVLKKTMIGKRLCLGVGVLGSEQEGLGGVRRHPVPKLRGKGRGVSRIEISKQQQRYNIGKDRESAATRITHEKTGHERAM